MLIARSKRPLSPDMRQAQIDNSVACTALPYYHWEIYPLPLLMAHQLPNVPNRLLSTDFGWLVSRCRRSSASPSPLSVAGKATRQSRSLGKSSKCCAPEH